MVNPSGSTAIDNQAPRGPGADEALHRRNLNEKIASLKAGITLAIQGTKWPSDSTGAAEALRKSVELLPIIPDDMGTMPQDLRNAVENYIQVLEDVHTRIKDASSKPGKQQWRLLKHISSFTSKVPSKCTLTFQTCQADVLTAADGFSKCLSRSYKTNDSKAISSTTTVKQKQGSTVQPSPISGTAVGEATTNGPMRQETLVALRKAFKGLEIASSSIPVAGNFVGAAAKVGLAFVETVQKMDGNEDLAKDLGTQTTRLLTLLQQFNNKSEESFIADRMNDLHGELRDILAEVNEWKAMGRFKKGFSARDHEETLKARQAGLQGILEQMQFLVSVDIQIMTAELRNNERQREIQRLLGVLGNGKYGARGNTLEDAVCLPGTRLAILERVDNWIKDTSSDSRVLWIRGMAGRGKSTIASTVVDNWSSRGSCALFHFRRGQTALNARVVCALARQLATTLSPGVKTAVLNAVRENQDIADKRLDKQFETLLVAPLATLSGHSNPVILVLDALDESEDGKEAIDLIDLLDRHSASLPPNVKFLLTSRPEGPLPNTLDSRNWKKEDLDVEADVSNDIELFVQWRLGRIRTSHRLPENWPQSEEVIRLVEMSQGLFQWARTALGYVQNGSPTDRLRMLLKHPARWSGLDDLYHQILQKAFHNIELDQERTQLLHKVLGTIVVAPVPIQLEVLGEFFGDQEYFDGAKLSDVVQFLRNDLLSDLASLIFIPASSEEALVLMHASIADLLTNKTRCNHRSYHIDSEKQHCLLAGLCLEHMVTSLKRNIGDLSQGLQSCLKASGVVKDKLSTTLRYSCLAWSVHLTKGAQDLPLDSTALVPSSFESFSLEKVLLWLEVMSLIGSIPDAIRMAQDVHQWLLKNCQELQKYAVLWDDIRRFVSMFAEPITYGPLHIYTSAIPWCPKETDIWRHYGSHAIVEAVRGGETTWSSNVWSRVVGDVVSTVAFSPDGKRIAVGTLGAIIQLHDRVTGSIIGKPLTYPTDMVNSVSFSPDGKVLASGSRDNKIQLWDIDTGCAIGRPLEGHNDWILSISFSPDGRVLASGSDDQSVRIWDPHTGCVVGQPLKGHSERIRCIAFSPDGKVLASASDDTTIRVWDTVTCEAIVQPLEGHPHPITSIAFSPDGKVLASARANGTVQLWNSQTWTSVGQPLNLHSTCIACISFSPDGKILASGSDDGAIQIQSLYNQKTIGHPLRGHSGQVNSISFSPDGRVLVSGSEDGTIRLWEVNIGDAIDQLPESQPEWMSSVSFWLGGTIFASVSKDSTIQIWDTYTGKVIGRTLEGHPDSVAFITYSCHTMVLASESHDGTLRLWNICTGDPIGQPLQGHTRCTQFSPDGTILAFISFGGAIKLCNTHTGEVIGTSLEQHSVIRLFAFSPDGRALVSRSDNEMVRLWDARTGSAIGEPFEGCSRWLSTFFSPDGKLLAFGSNDGTIRLYDPSTGQATGSSLKGHCESIGFLSFSPNGEVLVSGHLDGRVHLWDAHTWKRISTSLEDKACDPWGISFSPDGKALTTPLRDTTIQIWNTSTGEAIGQPLKTHAVWLSCASFLLDGNTYCVYYTRGRVLAWDITTSHSNGGDQSPFQSLGRSRSPEDAQIKCHSHRLLWHPPLSSPGSIVTLSQSTRNQGNPFWVLTTYLSLENLTILEFS